MSSPGDSVTLAESKTTPLVDVNDPVFTFLTGTAPPVARIEERDIDEALKQLRAAAATAVAVSADQRWVPGLSIVVVGNDPGQPGRYKVLLSEGFGTTSTKDPAPVTENTLFPCASLSKPVSASLIAGAYAEAHAGVTEPLWSKNATREDGTTAWYLAQAPEGKKTPTIRQWLGHRSGMPDHAGDLIEDMNSDMSRSVLLEKIIQYQTGIKPGEYGYTNFGFTMGCLGGIKVAANQYKWNEFAAARFKALGMTRSTYEFTPSPSGVTSDRVRPHQGKPDVPHLLDRVTTGWNWHVVDHDRERKPERQAPAGSLLSCAKDLGLFLLAHLEQKFGTDYPVKKPGDDESVGPSRYYSLGWNVANHGDEDVFTSFETKTKTKAINAVSFSHSGAFSLGAGTCVRFDPDARFGIAILSNGEPTGVPEALSQIFFKYLYATPMPPGCHHADVFALCRVLYMSDLYKKKIGNYKMYHAVLQPIPAEMPSGEIFRTHSDYYGSDIVLTHTHPDLILTMGQWSFKLSRLGQTSSYAYTTTGENEVDLSRIHLTWEGNLLAAVDDAWLGESGPGLGEFKRR